MLNNDEFKSLITKLVFDPNNPEINFFLGCHYADLGQYSSAGSYFLRSAERSQDDLLVYEGLIQLASCLMNLKRRRYSAKAILSYAISHMPTRPEAYYLMSKHVEETEQNEEKWYTAYTNVSTALKVCDFDNLQQLRKRIAYDDVYSLVFQKAHTGFHNGFIEEARELFHSIVNDAAAPLYLKKPALNNLMRIKKENDRSSYYHKVSNLKDVYDSSLSTHVLSNGGSIHPIVIPSSMTNGRSTMNPSVFVSKDNEVYVNLREINYNLYHSVKFPDVHGPLKYLYPDKDVNLRSENIICRLDDRLNVVSLDLVDMKLNDEPNWYYIGLEDARLVSWNRKTYLCGVRRDHIRDGIGRMDLSEIEITENGVIEVERFSIPAPGKNDTYCEKNWMPILDKPFHWVKWSNPTQVVKFDPNTLHTDTTNLDESKVYKFPRDLRGGSQVIRWKEDYYLAITHECVYNPNDTGRRYYQRIVIWDLEWNIVCSTREFTMMGGAIEFVSGIAYYNNDVLISFGYDDAAAFILRVPNEVFDDFVLRG